MPALPFRQCRRRPVSSDIQNCRGADSCADRWRIGLLQGKLRDVLGNRLPDKQEKFFRKLLGRKDEVNHGARSTAFDEAQRLLAERDDFAAWAEGHV